ncbi:hypothetical protein AAMO2058_001529800 [Amorphochlora amoebiformis]
MATHRLRRAALMEPLWGPRKLSCALISQMAIIFIFFGQPASCQGQGLARGGDITLQNRGSGLGSRSRMPTHNKPRNSRNFPGNLVKLRQGGVLRRGLYAMDEGVEVVRRGEGIEQIREELERMQARIDDLRKVSSAQATAISAFTATSNKVYEMEDVTLSLEKKINQVQSESREYASGDAKSRRDLGQLIDEQRLETRRDLRTLSEKLVLSSQAMEERMNVFEDSVEKLRNMLTTLMQEAEINTQKEEVYEIEDMSRNEMWKQMYLRLNAIESQHKTDTKRLELALEQATEPWTRRLYRRFRNVLKWRPSRYISIRTQRLGAAS